MSNSNYRKEDFPQWLAVITDQDSKEVFNSFPQFESVGETIQTASLPEAISYFKQNISPEVLIIDVSGHESDTRHLSELQSVLANDTVVIILGRMDSIAHYQAIKALGFYEYLLLPIAEAHLAGHLMKIKKELSQNRKSNQLNEGESSVIAVMGSRGGIGSTSLSMNVATCLAQQTSQPTCLIDFDFFFGNVALSLDLEQNNNLVHALTQTQRLDDVFFKRLCQQYNEELYVLSGLSDFQHEINFSSDAIDSFLSISRNCFTYTLIDLPHDIESIETPILEYANKVILVAEPSIQSLRDCARILTVLKHVNSTLEIVIVCLDSKSAAEGKIKLKQFEKSLDHEVAFTLPFARPQILASLNAGQPLCEGSPNQALSKAYYQIAEYLQLPTEDNEIQKSSFLNKLTGLFNGKT